MTYEPVTLEHLLAHQTWAIRVARHLVRGESEAEELVQRTWLAALRRPPNTERGARAWIRKVIQNLARERHRRDSARERHERESFDAAYVEPGAFESVSRREIHELLADRLLALDEPYRLVLTERFYGGHSSVEIARRLGIPAGTVRWRLKVGLDRMRAELDRRSMGDRSKWVSALLFLVPPGAEHTAGEALDDERDEALDAPESSGPSAATWLKASSWLGLAGGALGLGILLWRDLKGGPEASSVELADASANGASAVGLTARPSALRALQENDAVAGQSSSSAPPDALRLLVVDPAGQPVPDAEILVASAAGYERRTNTDVQGVAWLTVAPRDVSALGLPATRAHVSVRAVAPGREASQLWHVAPPFISTHEVRLTVGGPAHVVRGFVRDEHGHAVAGATLAWFDVRSRLAHLTGNDFTSPSYLSTTSDARGAFELDHLALGTETLYCFTPGFSLQKASPMFDGLAAEIELFLGRGASVTGVVHWPGGAPAAGVHVGCEPLLKSSEWSMGLPFYDARWHGFVEGTRTGADGSFRLEGIFSGKRTLWAEAQGMVASVDLTLSNGDEQHWDAELGKRPGLRLQLVDEAQHPLVGWLAFLRCVVGDSCWVRRHEADGEGRVFVPDCPEAATYLDVFDPSGSEASYLGRRLLPGEQEQVITVETRNTATIAGVLLDSDGQPLLDGKLAAYSLRTALSFPLERDSEGRFAQRLAGGGYALVLKLGQSTCKLAHVALDAGERRDLGTLSAPASGTLRLNAAALLGREAKAPSYSLFVQIDEQREERFLGTGQGELTSEVLLSLFPARYRVLVFDGSERPPTAHVVRITSFEETRLDLGR